MKARMTNKEAIARIENHKILHKMNEPMAIYISEALDMAIKALEQEPCEDCISLREAIKKFTYNYKGKRIPEYDCENWPVQIDIKTVKEILRDLPPVNPQSKTGHWITLKDEYGDIHEAICSCCDSNGNHKWMYCPNCGCYMVESQ